MELNEGRQAGDSCVEEWFGCDEGGNIYLRRGFSMGSYNTRVRAAKWRGTGSWITLSNIFYSSIWQTEGVGGWK